MAAIDVGFGRDDLGVARNPNSQRPRVPGWPRAERLTVGVSLLERHLLRDYAERNGLAVGAAARELICAALLFDADAHPSASEWNAALHGVRHRAPE